MALNGMLKIVGEMQGQIKGSVTQKGRENLIKVMAADHQVGAAADAATLQIVGKRLFTPFTIIKEVDLASIGLRRALATNESLKEWELKLWRVGSAGAGAGIERNHFTIRLSDARVLRIKFVLPDTRDSELAARLDCEEVAFIYKKISWSWNDPSAVHDDVVVAGTNPAIRKRR